MRERQSLRIQESERPVGVTKACRKVVRTGLAYCGSLVVVQGMQASVVSMHTCSLLRVKTAGVEQGGVL